MTTRILHIIDQYRIGGPGKTILNSARFLDPQYYKTHLGIFMPDASGETELASRARELGIPVLHLEDRQGFSLRVFFELRRYIIDREIDILHCHGYKSEFYAYLLKLIFRAPVIVTTHHGWIANNKLQGKFNSVTRVLSFLFDGVIVVSTELLSKLPTRTRELSTRRVIHNGIVVEDYVPQGCGDSIRTTYGLQGTDTVLGVIGRLSPEKGCFEIIDALQDLRRRFRNVKLVFVGEGPLSSDLSRYAKEKRIASAILFTGHIHPVQPMFEAFDVVVSPSYTEGISNVVLEAMAFRIPVVATAVGGTPEILEDGVNGLLVPPGNSAELAEAVGSVIANRELGKRFARNGYVTLREKFSFEVRMKKVQQLYDDAMASKGRNR